MDGNKDSKKSEKRSLLLFTETTLWLSLAFFLYSGEEVTDMIAIFRYFMGCQADMFSTSPEARIAYQPEEIITGQILTQSKYSGSSLTHLFLLQFHKHLLSSYAA